MSESPFHPVFDRAGYEAKSGDFSARGPITDFTTSPDFSRLTAHFDDRSKTLVRTGAELANPFVVPGAKYNDLWTWDAYFTSMALPHDEFDAEVGSLLNLLDALTGEGRPPSRVDGGGGGDYKNIGQPLHAAWMLSLMRRGLPLETGRAYWPRLLLLRDWWEKTCASRRSLYVWVAGSGTGIDNDPAIYGRAGDTVGLVDVNCFHYRELVAMGELSKFFGDESEDWVARAEDLRSAINTFMWDPEEGTYYHLDLSPWTWGTHQEITWEVPLRTQTWANLFPLWTGVATAREAGALIERRVLNPRHFLSPAGIRSTPASERTYNNLPMADPSNWQGPVWGLSTFLTAYGIARYGYRDEAFDIASRLIAVMDSDVGVNGCIHEFYDAENKQPLSHPDFLSWNMLGGRILQDIVARVDPTSV